VDLPVDPSSPQPHPLLAYPAVADVLLDRVQLGFEMRLPSVPAGRADAVAAALACCGVLTRAPAPNSALAGPLPVGALSVSLVEGGTGGVDGGHILLAAPAGGGLVLTARSHLILNPMRDLRSQLIDPGERAADGNDNVVWGHDPAEWPHLLGLQLVNVAAVVDAFVAAVARAAGAPAGSVDGTIWVQHCEVCRDYNVADGGAEALVRELAEGTIPMAVAQFNRRSEASRRRNRLCVAWHEGTRSSAERKVYAKRNDLLRAEVSVRSRRAVKALLARVADGGAAQAEIGGAGAARLLKDVALAAVPLLDVVREIVGERAALPQRAGVDMMLGFLPLLRLAAPAPRLQGAGGRMPAPAVATRARAALDQLVAAGSFDCHGLGASDSVLLALREMAAAGTLHPPPRGRRLFTVSPALEAARRALFAARLPDGLGSLATDAGGGTTG